MSSMAYAEDPRLLALASSIARGEPVAWEGAEATTTPAHLLDALKAIDAVAQLAGRIPDTWGRASITGELGHGAHGVVYAAHDPGLGIDLALKVVRPRGPDRRVGVANALKEAQLLAQVNHPNVVRVFWAEAIEAEVGVAMELVQGHTLGDLLRQRGPLNARDTMAIGVDLCRALGAVHAVNLLHGDIKAGNVMRTAGGRTVLMDFGVGQDLKTDDSSGLRRAGTPLYLAPELFAGGARSPQSDVYSTGVLLFHLATGSFPIDTFDAAEVERHHAAGKPLRRLRDIRPDLPDAFLDVVDRATAVNPDRRYRSAADLEAALFAALQRSDRRVFPWWSALVGAALASVVAVVYFGASRTSAPAEPSSDVRPAAADAAVTAADTYRVDAAVFRRQGNTDVRLAAGGRVAPGDELSLRISATVPVYAYVVNEDDRGASFLLFPLPGQALKNPLPPGTRHEIPGVVNGTTIRWQVSTAGGREHFLIFVTPQPPTPAFERMFADLPRPTLDTPVLAQPLSDDHATALRGVGGLAKAAAPSTGPKLSDAFAVPLSDAEETARGVWVRQLTLENPVR